MSVARPFHQTVRQFSDGSYSEGGRWKYLRHPAYANSPSNYVRAFTLLQQDVLTLFEYVEPADQNLQTYSFRTFELLLRLCTEVEANFKSIFRANRYSPASDQLNITDYAKIERSHFLSQYEVKFPHWTGGSAFRQPFGAWSEGPHPLAWYQAYNAAKHDRAENLRSATLEQMLDAFAGLAVVLAAQFMAEEYGPANDVLALEGPNDGFEPAIGSYLRIRYPANVPADDRYDFDWRTLGSDAEPFQRFNYDAS